MTSSLTPQPVVLVSRQVAGEDSYGNDDYTETQTPTTGIFAPGTSAEVTSNEDQVVTQPTLYDVPNSVTVKATDRFLIGGDTYEVDGDPQSGWVSPFSGWTPGQVIPLRKVTG